MSTYPSGIFAPTNPLSTDKMNVVPHSSQHTLANNEIVAIETALGVNLGNVIPAAYLDTDGTLSANSNTKIATQKAVKTYADAMVLTGGGIPLGYLDTDGTLAANSDTRVPSQKAVKTFVSSLPVITRGTFANGDLSAGVLTITHGRGLSSPYTILCSVFNNSGAQIIPDQINTLATNSFKVDLTSYGTLTGSWSYAYAS